MTINISNVSIKLDGTKVTILAHIENENFVSDLAPTLIHGDIFIDGIKKSLSILFGAVTDLKLEYQVPFKSSITTSGFIIIQGHILVGNVVNTDLDGKATINLNLTLNNVQSMVTSNDVAQAISNASYIQNVNGDRHFIWDINYSIKNLTSIPLGFKVTFLVEFKNQAGQAGTVLQVLKTLSTANGTFHFDIQDNIILTDNTMDLKVLMVTRVDNFAIANPALKRLTLVIDEPTLNKAITVSFPNGASNISTILTEIDSTFLVAKAVGAPHFNIVSNVDTTNPVTTTFALFAQLIDETGFAKPNVLFDIVFIDNHRLDFVLTSVDFTSFNNAQLFPTVALQNVRDTTANPLTIEQVNAGIQFHLDNEPIKPDIPNENSYTMELKSSSYLATPEGKTVNIQIEVTRIGTGIDNAIAILTIKQGLSGIAILNEIQQLQIGGANIFSIVFNIPDVPEATATLDFEVVMRVSETNPVALTQFPLTGKLIFGSSGNGNGVKQNSIMTKILGALAVAGTTVLLSSKGR